MPSGAKTRAAALVFAAVVVGAFPLYLVRGHEQWFFLDEWDFLADRDGGSLHDLLRPHNEHWSTLPIVVYRLLWRVVGLRTYVPYQVVIVALHLTAGVLVRAVMRRAGVRPWIATMAASMFVLLGAGRQDIVWAFQIGFVGSLVCGLAHLLLADHDGPLDRRDALGVGVGLIGLLCSGVAVTMTVVVGLAVLVRRGWRVAAVHTVPLALVFVAWLLAFARDAYSSERGGLGPAARFMAVGMANAFARMGQVRGVGALLGVLLVVGLPVAWGRLPVADLRRRAAAPAALLAGAVIFLAISGTGRSAVLGSDYARASRYAHLVAAMTLPAIAVAGDALIGRWRLMTPVVVVLLLIGIPGNVDAIKPHGRLRVTLGRPASVLAPARSPLANKVPPSLRPDPFGAHEVTIGWLRAGVRSGRIPPPEKLTPGEKAAATLQLLLLQSRAKDRGRDCVELREPVTRHVRAGDALVFHGAPVQIRLVAPDGTPSSPVFFLPGAGHTLQATGGPATLLVDSLKRVAPATLCRGVR